jgi:hypothetical protein
VRGGQLADRISQVLLHCEGEFEVAPFDPVLFRSGPIQYR